MKYSGVRVCHREENREKMQNLYNSGNGDSVCV